MPVKIVLVSAASSSGKSYTLRHLSKDEYFKEVNIFEMDSLRYYNKKKLNRRLPTAWRKFDQWSGKYAKNNLIDALYFNIRSSKLKDQLIKLKLVELMCAIDQVVTVLPDRLRHSSKSIRFIELLEEYFKKRIVHIAIIPSPVRYFLNLIQRKKSFSFNYLYSNLTERRLLISKKAYFDDVIKMPLWVINKDFLSNIFKKYIG